MNVYITIKKSSLIFFIFSIILTWQVPVYGMRTAAGTPVTLPTDKSDAKPLFLSRAALPRPRKPAPTRVARPQEIFAMVEAIKTPNCVALAAIISSGEFDINNSCVQHIIRDRAENQIIGLDDSGRMMSNREPLLWYAVNCLLAETEEDEAEKRLGIIDLLLYHDANPNQPAYFFHNGKKIKCHLLHAAVHKNHAELAQLLKAYNADPELTDQDGKKPADYLRETRSLILATILGVVGHAAVTAGEHVVEHVIVHEAKDAVKDAVASAVDGATGEKKESTKIKRNRGCSLANLCC